MTIKTMRQIKNPSVSRSYAIFLLFVCGNLTMIALANDTLTNASDVLALPAKEALSGIPISLKGVVTAAETNWNGKFFVQDSSGGIFVNNISRQQPVPGDVVEVSGQSRPGGYAPD